MKLSNIYIFKDLRQIYTWVSVVGSFLILGIIGSVLNKYFLAVLLFLLWVIATCLIFEFIKGKRLIKIAKYFDNCQARIFVNHYLAINQTAVKNDDYINLSLAIGYIGLGEFDIAYNYLKTIKIKDSNNLIVLTFVMSYYNSLHGVCIRLKKFDEAKFALDKILEILNKPCAKKNPMYYENFRSTYTNCSLNYKESIGEIEADVNFYKANLEIASKLSEKVGCNFKIADALLKQGDSENAKPYLEFVIENGGDFWHVAAAKEMLAQMAEKN